MKNPYFLFLLLAGSWFSARAQQPYQVMSERPNEKTYKGIITRELLEADSSFTWYASNSKSYNPNADAVAALKKMGDSLHFIAFMGTWCEDSHYIIPKFYALLDAAGFSKERVTLIGVDREKKTFPHLAEALQARNVPTLIVLKEGKELGRVVEYGKYGMFDKELGEIIQSAIRQ